MKNGFLIAMLTISAASAVSSAQSVSFLYPPSGCSSRKVTPFLAISSDGARVSGVLTSSGGPITRYPVFWDWSTVGVNYAEAWSSTSDACDSVATPSSLAPRISDDGEIATFALIPGSPFDGGYFDSQANLETVTYGIDETFMTAVSGDGNWVGGFGTATSATTWGAVLGATGSSLSRIGPDSLNPETIPTTMIVVNKSEVVTMDRTGNYVAGIAFDSSGNRYGFIYNRTGNTRTYVTAGGEFASDIWFINDDYNNSDKVIGGVFYGTVGRGVLVNTSFVSLGVTNGVLNDCTSDGTVFVGNAPGQYDGGLQRPFVAKIVSSAFEIAWLDRFALENDIFIPHNIILSTALSIDDLGEHITGSAFDINQYGEIAAETIDDKLIGYVLEWDPDTFAVPSVSDQFLCRDIDFNNDNSFFDPTDLDAFMSVYAEGPCIQETDTCDSIDFNLDNSVFDPCDVDAFVLAFSEGPCTPCGD